MTLIETLILAIIEGVTEFLPISSTGHMIIASHFMKLEQSDFVKNFEVIIQFGAILSVLFLYRKRFLAGIEIYKKIAAAFIPTAIVGFILKKQVDVWFESVSIVAYALLFGGIILIFSDKWFKKQIDSGKKVEELSYLTCVFLGLMQSLALIPGVSRSASTIIGGLIVGMQKKEAAEFSFFLAVPTMAAASLYKVSKMQMDITSDQLTMLFIGCVVAFIVAVLAIKFFISMVSTHGFKGFGIYRIILGAIVLFMIS